MTPSTADSTRRQARPLGATVRRAAPFLAFLPLILVLQHLVGTWPGEFGAHPDEGGHYVTGLLAHDYLRAGLPMSPLDFALRYYAHYPAIALGNWPPLFYGVEALWFTAFGVSRAAALTLVALTASLFATLTMWVASARAGLAGGLWAGVMLLTLPLVSWQFSLVSPEILVCALMLLTALAYARLVDRPSVRRGVVAGGVAALALLTKGNAFALALLPAVLIALNRRWRLLREPGLWTSAVVAGVLAVPWYAATMDYASAGWTGGPGGWRFTSMAVPYFARELLTAFGWPMAIVAMVGAYRLAREWRLLPSSWRAVTVLGVVSFAFHTIVPAGFEARFMISVLPACVLALLEGGRWISERVAAALGSPSVRRPLVVTGALAAIVLSGRRTPRIPPTGVGVAARLSLDAAGDEPAAVLVSSRHAQEVAFVAEFAMREPRRPRHYTVRAVKALARADWSGQEYEQTVTSVQEVQAYLDSIPVRLVVLDTAPGGFPFGHHDLLRRTLDANTTHWEPLATSNGTSPDAGRFVVYRRRGGAGLRPPKVDVTVKGLKATE